MPSRPPVTSCVSDLRRITSAVSPNTATDASISRPVSGSARNTVPPRAAIIGTPSWTVDAVVARNRRNVRYQTAYQMPEVRAPEAMA